MIYALITIIIIAAVGAHGRFIQGNGDKGVGRAILSAAITVGVFVGLAKGDVNTVLQHPVVMLWAAVIASVNLWIGRTDWDDIPYSIVRYGGPGVVAVLPWALVTQDGAPLLYGVLCSCVALSRYYLVQHKPKALVERFGNADIGTVPDGILVAGGMAILYIT